MELLVPTAAVVVAVVVAAVSYEDLHSCYWMELDVVGLGFPVPTVVVVVVVAVSYEDLH